MIGEVERSARINRAVAWALEPGPRPDAEDARLVAAIGLGRSGPVLEFLWRDPQALRAHWDALQAVMFNDLPAAPPPVSTSPAPYPTAPSPSPAAPSPCPPLTSQGQHAPGGAVPPMQAVGGYPAVASDEGSARWQRIKEWVEDAIGGRPELGALSEVDLQRLAESGAQTPEDVAQFGNRTPTRSLYTKLAPVLSRVMAGLAPTNAPHPTLHPVPQPPSALPLPLPTTAPPAYPMPTAYPAPEASPPAPVVSPQSPPQAHAVPAPEPETQVYSVPEPAPVHAQPEPELMTAEPVIEADPPLQPSARQGGWLSPAGSFAPFDWGQVASAAPAVPALMVVPADEGVRLAWEPAEAGACLYRVVEAADTWAELSPDTGTVLGATRDTEVLAALTPQGAVSFLTVWAHEGESEVAARNAQPRLLARGELVWPPTEFALSVTPALEVVARFEPPPGATVEVQRFAAGEMVRYDQSRALWDGVTPSGFVDRSAPPGVELTYAIYTVAELPDGNRVVSEPALHSARVVPAAQGVELHVEPGPRGTYDLFWTEPSFGSVEVYLTDRQPPAGLGDQQRTLEVIEDQGLTPDRRLNYPVSVAGDGRRMNGVSLDPTWVKGYFVALHRVSDDAVRLGPVRSQVNVLAPRNPVLVERVDTEIITFEWPTGVKLVEVYQGPAGEAQIDPERSNVTVSSTEEQYRQRGGLRLDRPLPSNGCALYLYGVVYEGGQPNRSDPLRLVYKGIGRLLYRVEPARRDGMPVSQQNPPDVFRVNVWTREQLRTVPVCLVANPTRLPLHAGDGQLLDQQPAVSPAPGEPSTLFEIAAGPQPAYVRLFVNGDPDTWSSVAILDPAIHTLKVMVR